MYLYTFGCENPYLLPVDKGIPGNACMSNVICTCRDITTFEWSSLLLTVKHGIGKAIIADVKSPKGDRVSIEIP